MSKNLREVKVNLEKSTDLTQEFPCPECNETTTQPEYICQKDQCQLVFYAKE